MGKFNERSNFAKGFGTISYGGVQASYVSGTTSTGVLSGIAEASLIYSVQDEGSSAFTGSAVPMMAMGVNSNVTNNVLAHLISDLGHRGVINVKNITDA
jgi:hypothetical protein